MTWGALYFYYKCSKCGKLYKYATDLIPEYGEEFGLCPDCHMQGEFITEGARIPEDLQYEEVD